MTPLTRRALLAAAAAPAVASAVTPAYRAKGGPIKHSVVHWCFNKAPNPLSVADLAKAGKAMGLESVELVGPEHWPMLKELGLTCAIAGSHGFAKGFAHVEEHAECLEKLRASIDVSATHGVPSVITFSGFRRELDDETATKNMIDGLKQIVGYAEEKNVTLCLEMLNSRVAEEMKGHPDYWCDSIDRALAVCRGVSSPRLKILFDIYHVQIMDGDVIRRMQECKDYLGHIHTAGNPGRAELDDRQEIHYPGIMRALADLGYTGYVGHEFIPTREDKLATLAEAVRVCDV